MKPRRGRKSVLLYVVGIVLIAAGAYLSYQLGQIQSGYSLLDQRRQEAVYLQEIVDRDATINELRRQLAILETSREIDGETYAQVEANLAQLQTAIQEQEEELVFYRGIVSPEDGMAGLRIQSLEIVPADSEQHHLMRLLLVQAIVHSRRVSGVVHIRLAGSFEDQVTEFDLEQIIVNTEGEAMAYGFRYFQSFEQELALPVGFEPDTVVVEVLPSEPRGEPLTQSFQWSVISG